MIDVNKDYSNSKTNKFGEVGEQLFTKLMTQIGYEVESLTDNPTYWEQDIDFRLTNKKTEVVSTWEVKWDNRLSSTDNIFFEVYDNLYKEHLGWGYTSKARYLAYGDANNEAFLLIAFDTIRAYVEHLKECDKLIHGYVYDRFGQFTITRKGALLNVHRLMDWCLEQDKFFMILREK